MYVKLIRHRGEQYSKHVVHLLHVESVMYSWEDDSVSDKDFLFYLSKGCKLYVLGGVDKTKHLRQKLAKKLSTSVDSDFILDFTDDAWEGSIELYSEDSAEFINEL